MENIYTRVLETWKSAGVSLVSAPEAALLGQHFRSAGLDVGNDFVEFYATIGGMADSEWDSNLWSCWSVEKILNGSQNYDREGVLFADWLIHSHVHLVLPE